MDLSGRKHSLSGGTLSVPADHASVERTRRRRQMTPRVAIIGGGVSGLTCAVSFAERGFRTAIFAEQIGQQTTSGAAAALWFPYDAEPIAKVIPWTLAPYKMLVDLVKDPRSGVSMRSEEHTSELQSHVNLVCRLLLEKKKKKKRNN